MQYNDDKYGVLIVKDNLTHGEYKRWGSRIDFDVHGPKHRGSVLKAAVAIGIISEPELSPKQIADLSGHHVKFMGNHLVDIYNDLVNGVKLDDPDCMIDWELKGDITQGELETWISEFRLDSLADKDTAVFRESIILGAILADILIKPVFEIDRSKSNKRQKKDTIQLLDAMQSKQLTWLFMNLLQEYDLYNATPEEDKVTDESEEEEKI